MGFGKRSKRRGWGIRHLLGVKGGACDAGVCVSCADGCRAPQDGRTPLMLAALGGNLEVARELISKGADIEA